MGVFGSIFGKKETAGKKEKKSLPWISLTSLDTLKEIEKNSTSKPQVIFKHSTTCGISRMVMNMFSANYEFLDSQIDLYYLDLHAYREVSNEVGYKFQVIHQSPQLLVIKNGIVVAHASHGAINQVKLEQYL